MTPEHPWEQLDAEPSKAFSAFGFFLHLGPGRSVSKAAQAAGVSASTAKRMARTFDWSARVEAYDRDLLPRISELAQAETAAQHKAALLRFRLDEERRAQRLTEAADLLLDLCGASMRAMVADGQGISPTLLASALNAAAATSEKASNAMASTLGVDELVDAVQTLGLMGDTEAND
ncbi:hypothetical protein [Synechococcus sp. 1G10]|uniref:hypothetical protein n=1 Tax=Synechococcus sp. 1G10 TaxID=2025605 RepID=UPI000B97F55F|nr:hypothetical protein [Synechococcus sp. 1G10]